MLLFLALSFYPSPAWPELIRAPVLTALRTAPVITIKQLLSLDIIKAGLYVEGRVNPQDPSLGVEEGAWGGGGTLSQVEAIKKNPYYNTLYICCTMFSTGLCVCNGAVNSLRAESGEGRDRFQEYSGEEFNQHSNAEPITQGGCKNEGGGLSASQHVTKHRLADVLITMPPEVQTIGYGDDATKI